MRHPDFLWTLPPSRPSTTGAEHQTLLLVKVAQDLVARPPTDAEIQAFTSGSKTLDQMVDGWLASAEFKAYAYYKMRIRTESDGTADSRRAGPPVDARPHHRRQLPRSAHRRLRRGRHVPEGRPRARARRPPAC